MTENTTTTRTGEERPCFVLHPDAGGPCQDLATVEVYGLDFCAAHGEEARLGALIGEHDEAETFLKRFFTPDAAPAGSAMASALKAALDQLNSEIPTSDVYWQALLRAYPNPPEGVRERVRRWQLDEGSEGPSVFELLTDTQHTLHRLMRIAYEDGERWLVEVLEEYRRTSCGCAC